MSIFAKIASATGGERRQPITNTAKKSIIWYSEIVRTMARQAFSGVKCDLGDRQLDKDLATDSYSSFLTIALYWKKPK